MLPGSWPSRKNEFFKTLAQWVFPSQNASARKITVLTEAHVTAEPLSEFTGINIEDGLAASQHNTRLYRKLLTKFHDEYQDFGKQFRAAQTDRDPDAALEPLHRLAQELDIEIHH